MKQTVFIVLFLLCAGGAFSQGKYGFWVGLGRTTAYKSTTTPAFEGFYLAKLDPHVYVGGSIGVERYSFADYINPAAPDSGSVLSIRQKSFFIFFSPKVDIGVGHHKHVHFTFSAGPGLYMGGSKFTSIYERFSPGGNVASDTLTVNNTYNVRNIIFRYGLGVSERLPTDGFWDVILTQQLSYIPGHLNYPGTDLKTSYFSIGIGLIHKYPVVRFED